ncbi:hypothetical protein [Ferribacterium limneticum]|uniref:hypothetical protein n=1 Tax=Ferribacterium limneticum TaxID=76259 RepID=UPI001CFB53E7|nr:hypothetical protein [Ferribacterium limneticum]UCV20573.1 hypothetical protein KI610_08420 [Ferribacterium limneticum]
MDNTDLIIKLGIGIASGFIGWLLAQVTSLVKDWAKARKIKALLLEELRDVDREMERVMTSSARDLQIYGAKGVGNSACIGVSNYIFSNYYKDALLSLNQNQRISYQLIHSLIRSLNEGLDSIRSLTTEIQKHHQKNGTTEETVVFGKEWGEMIKAEYINSAAIRWHVRYHIDNECNPDLSSMTEGHKNYLKFLAEVESEANKLIKSGESIDRKKFEEIYSPSSFGN